MVVSTFRGVTNHVSYVKTYIKSNTEINHWDSGTFSEKVTITLISAVNWSILRETTITIFLYITLLWFYSFISFKFSFVFRESKPVLEVHVSAYKTTIFDQHRITLYPFWVYFQFYLVDFPCHPSFLWSR